MSNTVFDILPQNLNLRLIDLKQNQYLIFMLAREGMWPIKYIASIAKKNIMIYV